MAVRLFLSRKIAGEKVTNQALGSQLINPVLLSKVKLA